MKPFESIHKLTLPGIEYRLLSCLGRGSFGEVWLAEAPGSIQVAVKIIRRAARQEEAERELSALELIKGLRHQNLLSLHASFVQEDQLVIVQELADGNLRQRLDACKLQGQMGIPPAELIGYFREAAEAIDYLHANGIHHRDIKSENILLLGQHAKVADYGLARMLEKQSLQSASSAGTPAYMAPEVWEGKLSPHTDQYSLAISYAELRLGRFPFPCEGMGQLFLAHRKQKPDLAPLGKEERKVLLRSLAKDPRKRYSSCIEWVRALSVAAVGDQAPGLIEVSAPFIALGSGVKSALPAEATCLVQRQSTAPDLDATRPVTPRFERNTDAQAAHPSKITTSVFETLGVKKTAEPPRTPLPRRKRRMPQSLQWAVPALIACILAAVGGLLLDRMLNEGEVVSLTPTPAPIQGAPPTTGKKAETKGKNSGPKSDASNNPLEEKPKPEETNDPSIHDDPKDKHIELALGGGVKLKFVRIEPGGFEMGSPADELQRKSNEHKHNVAITKPYYLGVHLVTQRQYRQIMGDNPSWFSANGGGKNLIVGVDTGNLPVEMVSWQNAKDFCKKISELETVATRGWVLDLPTEAEWEFAARAGTKTPFYWGATISTKQANYDGDYVYGKGVKGVYQARTTAVDAFAPNAWGLHDMHGNLWQWCTDWYGEDYYKASPRYDPPGPRSGGLRVTRGGAWNEPPPVCRSAYRGAMDPVARFDSGGFRVAVLLAPRQN